VLATSWARSSRRRRVEIALGVLWLVDGALQFQPYMFTRAFMAGLLGMANMGLPGPVARADFDAAELLTAGHAVWNAAFALLQIAIGFGLIWGRGRTVTCARGVSVLWALAVWTIGEGMGGMFMGGTSLLTGAPGAALLYAVIALVIWPPRIRVGVARLAWLAVWVGSALLELEATNHAAGVPGAQVADGRFGEPWPAAVVDRAIGHLLAGEGSYVAALIGMAAVFVGIGVLWPATRRLALTMGIGIAVFVGLAGQNLGGVLTGQGTDPGTGPLLILLALALWPASAPGRTGACSRPEAKVEAELLGSRGVNPDPDASPGAVPVGGGGDASLPRPELPVRAVADADQDRPGRRGGDDDLVAALT
jgi:hypothetical protein